MLLLTGRFSASEVSCTVWGYHEPLAGGVSYESHVLYGPVTVQSRNESVDRALIGMSAFRVLEWEVRRLSCSANPHPSANVDYNPKSRIPTASAYPRCVNDFRAAGIEFDHKGIEVLFFGSDEVL